MGCFMASAYDYANQSSLHGVGTEANFIDEVANLGNGGLDYARQLEVLGLENSFNAEQAQLSRDWQERMSNTAYQRASADIKAAGFNPAMMISNGGASVGSSPVAHSGSSSRGQSGSGLLSLLGGIVGSVLKTATAFGVKAMDNSNRLSMQELKNDSALRVQFDRSISASNRQQDYFDWVDSHRRY